MENGIDFLHILDPNMSSKIFMCFEDLFDLAHVSAVSRSWRDYVIANGLCKQLCVRLFPQLSKVNNVIELTSSTKNPAEVGSSNSMEWESLKQEHRAYTFLAQGLRSFAVKQLIAEPIVASSTDNYPEESIDNTLDPSERAGRRASYWSSKGQSNPAVPETLTYKLDGDLCLISEINIQPFQAFFQWGLPIYSAKAVRFRMGHIKLPADCPLDDLQDSVLQDSVRDSFVSTYTSEEFPMAQENRLQNFKLPEPVLCIGGFMQVELLGRVQRQEMDSLFYICVTHVQILGRSLAPAFSVDIDEHSKSLTLKVLSYNEPSPAEIPTTNSSFFGRRHIRDSGQIVNILRGNVYIPDYDWGEEDDESDDEEFVL
ncbi:hypothetical protein Ddye_017917 [Dipteronia dyeriana]|uniref:F-box domain-containing protein n=1 Tax=Dipteronia dyeriana TaxID=168575 RepID=A0AAD9UA59_9ROSI|nr:hypothetical protein Ddye_017917 [Dipteronia dyeriana]